MNNSAEMICEIGSLHKTESGSVFTVLGQQPQRGSKHPAQRAARHQSAGNDHTALAYGAACSPSFLSARLFTRCEMNPPASIGVVSCSGR